MVWLYMYQKGTTMKNKQIQELRSELLVLSKSIEQDVDGNSAHANNRRYLAKQSIIEASTHLHELVLELGNSC